MSASTLQYFNPEAVLTKLHGDIHALERMSDAYLFELPDQLSRLPVLEASACDMPLMRELVHQLTTTFGMFDAPRGPAILRRISDSLRTDQCPALDDIHALACEMIGLGLHLRHYLRNAQAGKPAASAC